MILSTVESVGMTSLRVLEKDANIYRVVVSTNTITYWLPCIDRGGECNAYVVSMWCMRV